MLIWLSLSHQHWQLHTRLLLLSTYSCDPRGHAVGAHDDCDALRVKLDLENLCQLIILSLFCSSFPLSFLSKQKHSQDFCENPSSVQARYLRPGFLAGRTSTWWVAGASPPGCPQEASGASPWRASQGRSSSDEDEHCCRNRVATPRTQPDHSASRGIPGHSVTTNF